MKKLIIVIAALVLIAAAAAFFYVKKHGAPAEETHTAPPITGETYTDTDFGFTFVHATGTQVVVTPKNDTREFPGATVVRQLAIGSDVTLYEVESPSMTITDEPNGHASPIAQMKYFYDTASKSWMVAYPEGREVGADATTSAKVSEYTTGGLPILSSSRRFDTRIIPLSPTRFVVLTSNGGEGTSDIASTVSLVK